jgi:GTP-binding protein
MRLPIFSRTEFVLSAASPADLPADGRPEVAFAGRSNAGKSSALNAITGRKALARVSKTPGRTQLINFFDLAGQAWLVDLPGYGFAQAPDEVRRNWSRLVESYFQRRDSLRGVILLVDARHAMTEMDAQMLDWAIATGRPCHLLLTKADKLNRRDATKQLKSMREALPLSSCTAQLFSGLTHDGVEEAQGLLAGWLGLDLGPKKNPEGRGGPSG